MFWAGMECSVSSCVIPHVPVEYFYVFFKVTLILLHRQLLVPYIPEKNQLIYILRNIVSFFCLKREIFIVIDMHNTNFLLILTEKSRKI